MTIEEDGDIEIWKLYHQLAPTTGELDAVEAGYRSTSTRATWEPLNFRDDAAAPNLVTGRVEIAPPARPESPQNVEIGLRGVGVHTFSREYSQRYNRAGRDGFFFKVDVDTAHNAAHLDLTLPDLVPDPNPRLEVFRVVEGPKPSDHELTVDELVQAGKWVEEKAETEACRSDLRYWAQSHRILLDVTNPLPGRIYRVSWSLPVDEFEVLAGEFQDLREPVRQAIGRLNGSLRGMGKAERGYVQEFLARVGRSVRDYLCEQEPIRVDIAVDDGDKINVVEAVQLADQGQEWTSSPLRPICRLGETLRGKAFLQRTPRYYAPDIPDSKKDPNRDPMERVTQHQLALPLVYPPALPYWPRVGVLTLSSERPISGLFEKVVAGFAMEWLIALAHTELLTLANALEVVFPKLPKPFDRTIARL